MGMVRCLECGKILESKSRHDFQSCGCPNNTFVDGGEDYLRCGGKDLSKVQVITTEEQLVRGGSLSDSIATYSKNKKKE